MIGATALFVTANGIRRIICGRCFTTGASSSSSCTLPLKRNAKNSIECLKISVKYSVRRRKKQKCSAVLYILKISLRNSIGNLLYRDFWTSGMLPTILFFISQPDSRYNDALSECRNK